MKRKKYLQRKRDIDIMKTEKKKKRRRKNKMLGSTEIVRERERESQHLS